MTGLERMVSTGKMDYPNIKIYIKSINGNAIIDHQKAIADYNKSIRDIVEECKAVGLNKEEINQAKSNVPKVGRISFTEELFATSLNVCKIIHEQKRVNAFNVRDWQHTDTIVKVNLETCNEEKYKLIYKGFNLMVKGKPVKYVLLNVTNGGAKAGKAYFIRKTIRDEFLGEYYQNMGAVIDEGTLIDLVALESYRALCSSHIVSLVKLHPHEILILDDVEYKTETQGYLVYAKDNGMLDARLESLEVESSLFDGEGLIQYDIDGVNEMDGFVLLRHQFTKSCAFKCDLKQFFKDSFGDRYETEQIQDMFGNHLNVKDIKLVMCKSSVKWVKFMDKLIDNDRNTYRLWHDAIINTNDSFGVVKDAHESKLKDVSHSNYQFTNSMLPATVDEVMKPSIEFLNNLKDDDELFMEVIEAKASDFNNYELWHRICTEAPSLRSSEFVDKRIQSIYRDIRKDIKAGKIIHHGRYMTICGNPIALLNWAIGKEPTDEFEHEDGCIQCYCKGMPFGEYLGGARSPHNSRNNLVALHNTYCADIDKYMRTGDNVVIVNQRSVFQARTNGSDEDGDTLFVTNDAGFVDNCRKAMIEDYVVVNGVVNTKVTIPYSNECLASVDYGIREKNKQIGTSSNLAQICQTMYWITGNFKYYKYCIILAVVAQIAIDSAKKSFECDIALTTRCIKNDTIDGFFWWWQDVTGNKKKNATLEDDKSFIAKCMRYPLPRYESKINMGDGELFNKVNHVDKNFNNSKKIKSFITKSLSPARIKDFIL